MQKNTTAYKIWLKRRALRILRHKIRREFKKKKGITLFQKVLKVVISPPRDFRLLNNTKECLRFFERLRKKEVRSKEKGREYIYLSFKKIEQIDYASVSVLKALNDDFRYRNLSLRGDFPLNEDCLTFLFESGFLNEMYDQKGHRFPKHPKSETLYFEKGAGKFLETDNRRCSEAIKNAVQHMTGRLNHCNFLKTLILEISGNSIEWSNSSNKQWLLGMMYHKDGSVNITITDVGEGILSTLHRKFSQQILEMATTKDKILMRAFERKYGSRSMQVNRNRGLPCVKHKFDAKRIRDLVVITNNVILDFDNQSNSVSLDDAKFSGTFYSWTVDEKCLLNK